MGTKCGPEPVLRDGALWAFMAWQDWWKASGLRPVFVEQMVWHAEHRYAGTMDLLARDESGDLVVVDFKTSKAIYAEAELQTAAYAYAIEHMGHGKVSRGMIVRLPKTEKDPAFETRDVEDLAACFETFKNVLQVHRWNAKHEQAYRDRMAAERAAFLRRNPRQRRASDGAKQRGTTSAMRPVGRKAHAVGVAGRMARAGDSNRVRGR